MQSSLGIYIDSKKIKYAKLQKSDGNISIVSYDIIEYNGNFEEKIHEIIAKTNSYKIPISINIMDEIYYSFEEAKTLSSSNLKKSIDLEFEVFCNDNNYANLTYHYIKCPNYQNTGKDKIILISEKEDKIEKLRLNFEKYKLCKIVPISTSILNLLTFECLENSLIVNVEDETIVTQISEGKVVEINRHLKENCVYEIKKLIENSKVEIKRVYLTGGYENLDKLIKANISNVKIEYLCPYFVPDNSDYSNVNSAIALALEGLNQNKNELDFYKPNIKLKQLLMSDVSKETFTQLGKYFSYKFKDILSLTLDSIDKLLLRMIFICICFIFLYSTISSQTLKKISVYEENVYGKLKNATSQVEEIENDISKIIGRTNTYRSIIKRLNNDEEDENEKNMIKSTTEIEKDAIFNLLNRIMVVIPQEIKIVYIENTSSEHIKMKIESEKYEQLGYFKAVLSTNGILTNVKSTSGEKSEGNTIEVIIEGDLP